MRCSRGRGEGAGEGLATLDTLPSSKSCMYAVGKIPMFSPRHPSYQLASILRVMVNTSPWEGKIRYDVTLGGRKGKIRYDVTLGGRKGKIRYDVTLGGREGLGMMSPWEGGRD